MVLQPYIDLLLGAGKTLSFSFWLEFIAFRIVDFERDPPAGAHNYGKLHIELWDTSGDFKYEKCWDAIKKDTHGVIFVYNPKAPNIEEQLN